MPLSQSLSIMKRMKDEAHIDPDLFDVFMKHEIYLTYAKKFLQPEQLDI
jgi:HD-GYP domain-containing protein (c-di-GMP phosphodiesterase class II)